MKDVWKYVDTETMSKMNSHWFYIGRSTYGECTVRELEKVITEHGLSE